MTAIEKTLRLILLLLVATFASAPLATGQQSGSQQPKSQPGARSKRSKEDAAKRAQSLRAIAERLKIGPGSVIADIGAGSGRDSWVFADIVGESGQVLSEEISDAMVKKLAAEVEKRGLPQVKTVLGKPDDPLLPANSVDMAFMHYVYHHVSLPGEMLRGMWNGLKPGGYLVIVDRHLGTLVDWVPREQRAKKHFFIAETTVVREARENGFRFVESAEDCWHVKNVFVLVFQRPADLDAPDRDPDPLPAMNVDVAKQLLPPNGAAIGRVAFVALGEGRKLIEPIVQAEPTAAVDIVLEEWATRKDERPPLPTGVEMPSVLTEKGDPQLRTEPIDALYFLDTYHLLFHGPVLLKHLRERLAADGRVYVLDRAAPTAIPHREASHRRMIAPEMVTQEMAAAGFRAIRVGTPPAEGRFLLVFGKAEADKPGGNAAAE